LGQAAAEAWLANTPSASIEQCWDGSVVGEYTVAGRSTTICRIVIRADESVRYGGLTSARNALRDAGFTRMALMTSDETRVIFDEHLPLNPVPVRLEGISPTIVRIVSPIFYALGRSRTPVIVSALTVLVNAGLNIALVRVLGFRGLALGTSIAALFNAVTLLVVLRNHLQGIHDGRILGAFARISIAAGAMGVVAALLSQLLETRWPGSALLLQVVRLSITIGVALVVLGLASWLLRIREFNEGMALVARRLGRRSR
jgi:hypothetical protein